MVEELNQGTWMFSQHLGDVLLRVHPNDLERAQTHLLHHIRCRNCRDRRWHWPLVSIVLVMCENKTHGAKMHLCNLFRGPRKCGRLIAWCEFPAGRLQVNPAGAHVWSAEILFPSNGNLRLHFALVFVSPFFPPPVSVKFSPFLPSPPAHEVPAAAAEVPGVSRGRQSPGGSAGAARRADAPQVQHRSHPRAQRVCFQHSVPPSVLLDQQGQLWMGDFRQK